MSSATKQKSSAGKNCLIFFLVIIVLVAAIVIGLRLVFKNKNVTPSIAGYSFYIMDSNQMGDQVPRGALVVAANSSASLEKVGKAFLCENVPGVGTSVMWLSDVTSDEGADSASYVFYYEKNTAVTYTVSADKIVGEATTYYVWAGKTISFITSQFGSIICIGSPIALLILIELIIAIATHEDEDDDEEDEDDDDENEPVKLDDFLYSGDDETPLRLDEEIKSEPSAEENTSDIDDISFKNGDVSSVDNDTHEEINDIQPVVHSDKEDFKVTINYDEDMPDINKAVRTEEKASTKTAKQTKSTNASIEELMQMMEEEQKRLKSQIDNNNE